MDGTVAYGQVINGNWQGGDPRMLRVGERALPQAVLMTLYTPGKLRLVVDLPESRYFAIKSDQKVSISPVAFPELKYEGICEPSETRAPAAATAGGYALQIAAGEFDSRLLPGMKATIHMDVPLAEDALLVPSTAVANSTVWVHESSGKEEPRHVLTGRSDGKSIEILSGVKEGDQVLTHAKPS
jgi:multidrug efflux pump subunit AcrA (membrane-fusion protein)